MEHSGPLELLDALESLGLLAPSQASTLRAQWSGDGTVTHNEAVEQLVDGRVITAYQAQRLLEGAPNSLVVAGRYQIRELLGAGAMGAVYLAADTQLGRTVALKVLPAARVTDAGAVARFQREAKALARLAHANIVQAYDAGSDGGEQHYLVMEHVEGANLAELLKQSGARGPATAADYAYQAALGLAHAHAKGLVHRDLKPANLIVTPAGRVKILDLGLARFLQDQIEDETLTVDGTALGTPDYMAPEQFGGARHADERSDVYALGCTLYHMLAGRVPFPGSSISAKREAHCKTQPQPVHELRGGIPAGLSQAAAKMMAKRPADRFQTAGECAVALLPYVDGSSASLPDLQSTTGWQGGQLRVGPAASRRRRQVVWALSAAALLVAGALGALLVPKLFPRGEPGNIAAAHSGDDSAPAPASDDGTSVVPENGGEPTPAAPAEPWLLTVAQDGSGQFTTIAEAVEKLRPGMTLRVLDDAVYRETLQLTSPSNQRGVTLEAVRGATLEVAEGRFLVSVEVPDVTIRGFHFRAIHPNGLAGCVSISGDANGTTIEDVETEKAGDGLYNGIEAVGAVTAPRGADPIVIRNCTFKNCNLAVALRGDDRVTEGALPLHGVILCNSRFVDCKQAVLARGMFHKLQIVGNRIWGADTSGVQLQHLFRGSTGVLVANNTMFECHGSFRVWDDTIDAADVQVLNNLILAPKQLDMWVIDSGGDPVDAQGIGDGALAARSWRFEGNYREFDSATLAPEIARGRIPVEKDVERKSIEGVDTDPASPGFLRPDANAEVATAGAGQTDPALPTYVGAVPPEGAPPWDWSRTWRAPPGKNAVLTVSQNPAFGAQYKTIKAALQDAEPWDTIRVLDDATYEEEIEFNDPKRHAGVRLEAVQGATIQLPPDLNRSVTIRGVAEVGISGFHFAAVRGPPTDLRYFVHVLGDAPGTTLESLRFEPQVPVACIVVQSAAGTADRPIVIRRCLLRCSGPLVFDGIQVFSNPGTEPTRYVRVESNRILGAMRGIWLAMSVKHVHVTGNRLFSCDQSGLQLENPGGNCRQLLLANNTTFRGMYGFRLWEDAGKALVQSTRAELRNNLIEASLEIGMVYVSQAGDGTRLPGDRQMLVKVWRFGNNQRDLHAAKPALGIPFDPTDLKTDPLAVIDRNDVESDDFLRPRTGSPLAVDGAGGDLPVYVGAAPPPGVPPWNWDVTWRSRMMRAKYSAEPEPEESAAETDQP